MRIFLILLFSFLLFKVHAGDIKYPVSQIPKNLMENANVVFRYDVNQYQLNSLEEAVYKNIVVITVLNEKGRHHAQMVVNYNKLSKVLQFEGALYDAAGNQLKKLKSKEIGDYSAVSEISIMEDSRVKVHDFNYHTYPYTVEYEVEQKYYSTFFIPAWFPQTAPGVAVQQSSYEFLAPADYKLQYKAFNYNGKPQVSNKGKLTSMLWEAKDLPVVKLQYASPNWRELTTSVSFSPSEYQMEGYKGKGTSWVDYGKFQIALHEGRDKLPENIVEKVQALTSGLTTDKEKIKAIYEFMQQNTRYISVQLGIGGWQPFEATYVAAKGYGDCKALSNYMYSLLKAVNIRSHYALIRAGQSGNDRFMMEDFPSNQFNHMVLCVPLAKDTMWLECTSQTDPAGYMGAFTGNRKALIITEEGGKLVSTPRYGLNENLQLRKLNAKLNEEGSLQMNVLTTYKGIQQDQVAQLVNNYGKEKIQKYLQERFSLATYEINSFNYKLEKSALPEVTETLAISVPSYANVSGKRLFIVPNILNRGGMRLDVDTARKVDFVFNDEYRDEDRVEIEIPEGYTIESQSEPVNLKTKYGSYTASSKVEGNKIIYTRIVEKYSGRFPAKEGADIAAFYEEMFKSDRSRLVFVKSTE